MEGAKIFTRIVKVLACELRKHGFHNIFYLDDSLLISHTYAECKSNVDATIDLLQKAGFDINYEKSVIAPTHRLQFLGFIIDSVAMKVILPDNKVKRMKDLCMLVLSKRCYISIQEVATLVGTMISYMPAMTYGRMHYRALEFDKILGLRKNSGNFNAMISLSNYAVNNIEWWIINVESSGRSIGSTEHDVVMFCDASLQGYGCVLNGVSTGSRWSNDESVMYGNNINALELLAILQSLKSFSDRLRLKTVLVRSDNTTAVCYVNAFGGIKSQICDSLAREIWVFCIEHDIYLIAAHIKGVHNVEADRASRVFNDDIEYMVSREVFQQVICSSFGIPEVDCFASRLNNQVSRYFSWKPDPSAEAIDAFTKSWSDLGLLYIFCPFSLLGRVLAKIQLDQATAVLVYPQWKGQHWWPRLMMMVTREIMLPQNCIQHPVSLKPHPIPHLKMMAGLVKSRKF